MASSLWNSNGHETYASHRLVFGLFLMTFAAVSCNPGTEFVLAFPQSWKSPSSAEVMVAIDENVAFLEPSGNLEVILEMAAPQEVLSFALNQSSPTVVIRMDGTRVFPRGIVRGQQYVVRLLADDRVVVEVRTGEVTNIDMYLALPTNLLGTSHYAMSYPPLSGDGHPAASFLVVASTESATDVKITLPDSFLSTADRFVEYNGMTFTGGDTIELSLLSLEAFQLQSTWDLTGCRVDSNLPVAVWTGLNRTHVLDTRLSHLVMQVPHVGMTGRNYAILPPYNNAPTVIFRVVAIESCAIVTVHHHVGDTDTYELAMPGSFLEITTSLLSDYNTLLESTKDVQVYRVLSSKGAGQYTGLGGEAVSFLPPLDQPSAVHYVFTYPGPPSSNDDDNTYYVITMVTPYTAFTGLTINGVGVFAASPALIASAEAFFLAGTDLLVVVVATLLFSEHEPARRYTLGHTEGIGFVGLVDVFRTGDGEARTLGYPSIGVHPTTATQPGNTAQDVCIQVDENRSAMFQHTDMSFYRSLDAVNPYCTTGDGFVTCERQSQRYLCTPEDYGKVASDQLLRTAPSTLHCFRSCLSFNECVGVNYDVSNRLGTDNCQLLIGRKLGNTLHSSWKHIKCSVTVSFI